LFTNRLFVDCKTDVYFNTLSLLFPFIGAKTGTWWLDPVGAGLLSLYIIYDWAGTCFEQITRLSGQAADPEIEQKVLYLCYRFSPVVEGFKSIVGYQCGDNCWVEVDILLPQDTKLNKSHDIAETLQYCLEGLKEVDRAFVTTDCKLNQPPDDIHDLCLPNNARHEPGTLRTCCGFRAHLKRCRSSNEPWLVKLHAVSILYYSAQESLKRETLKARTVLSEADIPRQTLCKRSRHIMNFLSAQAQSDNV
jgi:hypothetical protein